MLFAVLGLGIQCLFLLPSSQGDLLSAASG